MSKRTIIKRFRQTSHPRKNLSLTQDAKNRMKSEGRVVPDVNPEAVYKELLNYFDPYDVGLDIGYKEIRHVPNRDAVNSLCFKWNKKPKYAEIDTFGMKLWKQSLRDKDREIYKTKFNSEKVYEHMTKQKKWYYLPVLNLISQVFKDAFLIFPIQK